jgi:hypothetical protein
MSTFLKLKRGGEDCLVNVDHIQQVRPFLKGVRIFWGTYVPREEDTEIEAYFDHDDFDITLDQLVELLRHVQVEVL